MRALVWAMIPLLPASAMAADGVGVMTATGSVLVDRLPVSAGTNAIFTGDTIDTATGSRAVITRRGSSITVGENSSVRFGAQTIDVVAGTIVVASSQGMVTKIDNATITTRAGEPARFLARKNDGEVQVLALEGRVYVDDGQQQTPVPPTRGVKLPKIGKGGGWINDPDIGTLIVVAAAITAGVTLGIVNAENAKPASRSVP
jgi:ferric-dicitrate binding protein FerR (iron transport regulator)